MVAKKRKCSFNKEWSATYSCVRPEDGDSSYLSCSKSSSQYLLWPNWFAVESTWGQSIGVYEPKARIQMFLIQLDRLYIKVLSYLPALVTCPTLSHKIILLVPHLVCLCLATLLKTDISLKHSTVLITFLGRTAAPTSGNTVAPPAGTSLIYKKRRQTIRPYHWPQQNI